MSKLRQLARGEDCKVRLSCCDHNPAVTEAITQWRSLGFKARAERDRGKK